MERDEQVVLRYERDIEWVVDSGKFLNWCERAGAQLVGQRGRSLFVLLERLTNPLDEGERVPEGLGGKSAQLAVRSRSDRFLLPA